MKKNIIYLVIVLLLFSACKKQYITNEYITYETYENIYYSDNYYVYLADQKEVTDDIRPPYLVAGDSVAIIATSNYVTESEIANGKAILESWGLKVKEAENLYYKDGRYAGNINERANGLQKMIDNPNIKALIAARGGYGCAQIIDKINLSPLNDNPKWLVGFSDLTVMHSAINNKGIETIHGAMAYNLSNATSRDNLKKALFGDYTTLSIPTNENCTEGTAEGRLVGGNLSIIYSLGGTLFDYNMKNAILFIEDTGESNYALDRMLMNLKLSGKLFYIQGVVVGQFTNMTTGIDKSVEEIITGTFKNLGIPVMYGINSGHGNPNFPLYLGRPIKLEVNSDNATITFEE
ncbi:LD-carboxypeptidase [Paludibacter sp. 221]|uniref:S66 peptidase family protein n=1 Tax=Paludibacter sp. 221 TaxID=2302939 RepID=UPI0013D310D2|nr:LD-carboxypeptidase [Paludibacter sp. 221]NDV46896.1 LD-carboxypeptidase [Paludibacter sp. 221]